MARTKVARFGTLLAGAVALAGAGCAVDYVTGSTAPVNLIITALNGGSPLDSDVRNGEFSTFVCEDEVIVTVAVRNKNPNGPAPSVPSAVLLQSYEVRYFRSDGRGTEGIDIPYRITGSLTLGVDVSTSTNSPVIIEVVRRQAKLEPPLSNIQQAALLTTSAEITLYGQTVAGQQVSASGRMQITFGDFGDTETNCPAN